MRFREHKCKYRYYLYDLGLLLKEYALEIKKELELRGGDEFLEGELLGYYRMITLMQQQAEGFDIPLEDLRLEDINPDRDLIWVPPSVDNPSHE